MSTGARRRGRVLLVTTLLLAALFGIEVSRERSVVVEEELLITAREPDVTAQIGVRYVPLPGGVLSSVQLRHDSPADVVVHLALVAWGPDEMLADDPRGRPVDAEHDVSETVVEIPPRAAEKVYFESDGPVSALRIDARAPAETHLMVVGKSGDRHPGSFAFAAIAILIPGLLLAFPS